MKLDTNFRKSVHLRCRYASSTLVIVAIVLLSFCAMVLININNYTRVNADRKVLISEFVGKVEKLHEQVYENVNSSLDARSVTDFVSGLPRYRGGTPSAVLFELEKKLPKEAYLSSFKHDRRSGVSTFSVVSPSSNLISLLMSSLEQSGDFKEVILLSQSEKINEKSNKYVIKIIKSSVSKQQ